MTEDIMEINKFVINKLMINKFVINKLMINKFVIFLKSNKYEFSSYYDKLPFDIQEIIYKMIKKEIMTEWYKRNYNNVIYSIQNIRKSNQVSWGGYVGGAWEVLYLKELTKEITMNEIGMVLNREPEFEREDLFH